MSLAHPFDLILSTSYQQQSGQSHWCTFCFLNMYSSLSFLPFLFPLKRMLFSQIFSLLVPSQMLTLQRILFCYFIYSHLPTATGQSVSLLYHLVSLHTIICEYLKLLSSLFIVNISSTRNLACFMHHFVRKVKIMSCIMTEEHLTPLS